MGDTAVENKKPTNINDEYNPEVKLHSKAIHANRLLFAQGFVENRLHVELLIDSGASISIISKKCFDKLQNTGELVLRDCNVHLVSADLNPMVTYGIVTVDLNLVGIPRPTDLIVAEIDLDGIIGIDYLKQTGCIVDFKRNCLRHGNNEVLCHNKPGKAQVNRIQMDCNVTIFAGEQHVFPAKITGVAENMGFIEPLAKRLDKLGLVMGRALVNNHDGECPVRVANPGSEDITLYAGMNIGLFTRVHKCMRISEREDLDELNHRFSVHQIADNLDTGDAQIPEHLQKLYDDTIPFIDEIHARKLANILITFQSTFSASENDVGRTNLAKHVIDTGNALPIKLKYRRQGPTLLAETEKHIRGMLEKDIIEPSNSPWSAPLVIVPKKGKGTRLACDFRALNAVTKRDSFPLVGINESFDSLSGAKFFSTLDVSSSYWNVEMDESSKEKTAFTTRDNLYQFKRMPYGLINSSATWVRLMEKLFRGLQWKTLLIYVDDIIVFGNSISESLDRLAQVLERLKSAGIKLRPAKCSLFRKSVVFLGHVISDQGIGTDPEKLESIRQWVSPRDLHDARSVLGLMSYYRRFVPKFADLARPLQKLTEKGRKFVWSKECEESFIKLKHYLTTSPILAYPTPNDRFILDTDASGFSIGAVLSQEIEGEERVISYASKSLNKAERNYCVTRREFYAVIFYCKKFRHYLYGREFTIRTDHIALKWLRTMKMPEGQIARWITTLELFDYKIEFRPGKLHGNADAMSRGPCRWCEKNEVPHSETCEVIMAVCYVVTRLQKSKADAITYDLSWERDDLISAQKEDSDLKWILASKRQDDQKPIFRVISNESSATKYYWAKWERIIIEDGILRIKWEPCVGSEPKSLLILPKVYFESAFEQLHECSTGAHLGFRKVYGKFKERFHWHNMKTDIKAACGKCEICAQKNNPPKHRRGALRQFPAGAPLECVATDILGPLVETSRGNKYIIVIADYFTKWTEAFPIASIDAETTAKVLVTEFLCRFGACHQLHSDQGRNYEAKLLAEICRLFGIMKTRTTPLHPQSDGQVEAFNKCLASMLSKVVASNQSDWDLKLPYVMMGYRSSVHHTTGKTPFEMMFGRNVNLPLDVMMGEPIGGEIHEAYDYPRFVREQLADAHEMARSHMRTELVRQKKNYDKRENGEAYKKGDRVWIYNPRKKRGLSKKLQRLWEGPYLVLKCIDGLTYQVAKKERAKPYVVHFDRLKPFSG